MTDTPQVTEAMIEAGLAVLTSPGTMSCNRPSGTDEQTVRAIYLAMTAARPTVGEEELVERLARAIHDEIDLSEGLKLDMAMTGDWSKIARAALSVIKGE